MYPEDVMREDIPPVQVTTSRAILPRSRFVAPQNFTLKDWYETRGLPPTYVVMEQVIQARFRQVTWTSSSSHPYGATYIQPVLDIFNHLLLDEGFSLHVEMDNAIEPGTKFCISLKNGAVDRMVDSYACIVFFETPGTLEKEATYDKENFRQMLPESLIREWVNRAFEERVRSRHTRFIITDTRMSLLLQLPPLVSSENNPVLTPPEVLVRVHDSESGSTRLALARLLVSYIRSSDTFRLILDSSYTRRGALNSPGTPLPTKDDLFATRRRFDDFDVYSIERNKKLFEDLLEWNIHIQKLGDEERIKDSTILTGTPNGFLSSTLPTRSPRPPQPLPSDTAELVEEFRRPRFELLDEVFACPFHLQIINVLRSGHNHWSQVYAVRVIPDHSFGHMKLPLVCLKVYDERFFATPEYSAWPNPAPMATYNPAVELVRREEAAYHSLRPVQGSFFPHCFGFHTFTYSSGWQAYGVILELVPGEPSMTKTIQSLNDPQVVSSLIINIRHAIRVLRYADIRQTDWNGGQIIFHPQEGTGVLVPVLIDFAFAVQSEVGYDVEVSSDRLAVRELLEERGVSERLLDELWFPSDHIEL